MSIEFENAKQGLLDLSNQLDELTQRVQTLLNHLPSTVNQSVHFGFAIATRHGENISEPEVPQISCAGAIDTAPVNVVGAEFNVAVFVDDELVTISWGPSVTNIRNALLTHEIDFDFDSGIIKNNSQSHKRVRLQAFGEVGGIIHYTMGLHVEDMSNPTVRVKIPNPDDVTQQIELDHLTETYYSEVSFCLSPSANQISCEGATTSLDFDGVTGIWEFGSPPSTVYVTGTTDDIANWVNDHIPNSLEVVTDGVLHFTSTDTSDSNRYYLKPISSNATASAPTGNPTAHNVDGTWFWCMSPANSCTPSVFNFIPEVAFNNSSETFVFNWDIDVGGLVDSDTFEIPYGALWESPHGLAEYIFLYSGWDLMRQCSVGDHFKYSPFNNLQAGQPISIEGYSKDESPNPSKYETVNNPVTLTLKVATSLQVGQRDYVAEQFGGNVTIHSCASNYNTGV